MEGGGVGERTLCLVERCLTIASFIRLRHTLLEVVLAEFVNSLDIAG
jgi:hypothetical protein